MNEFLLSSPPIPPCFPFPNSLDQVLMEKPIGWLAPSFELGDAFLSQLRMMIDPNISVFFSLFHPARHLTNQLLLHVLVINGVVVGCNFADMAPTPSLMAQLCSYFIECRP